MKTFIQNVLLFVVSIIVSVLILEAGYRYYLFGNAMFDLSKMRSFVTSAEAGMFRAATEPGVVFELKPNLDQLFKLAPFRTNADGLADRNYSKSRRDGSYRIAVVGDSYTMASGVAQEHLYHSLLEQHLNKQNSERRFEVINFGVAGYSLEQYLATIKHKVNKYQPDMVLVGFCPTNDYQLPEPQQTSYRLIEVQATDLLLRSYVWVDLKWQVKRLWRKFGRGEFHSKAPYLVEQEQYMNKVFSEMNDHARNEGIPILVAYLSTNYKSRETPRGERLAELLADYPDISYLNLGPEFEGMRFQELKITPNDGHPNKKAHARFAHGLIRYFEDNESF